jgi:hypothetical protein
MPSVLYCIDNVFLKERKSFRVIEAILGIISLLRFCMLVKLVNEHKKHLKRLSFMYIIEEIIRDNKKVIHLIIY